MKLSWILLGVLMWLLVVRCSCATDELKDLAEKFSNYTCEMGNGTVGSVNFFFVVFQRPDGVSQRTTARVEVIWFTFQLLIAAGCGVLGGLAVWGIVVLIVECLSECLECCKRRKVVPAGKKEHHQKPFGV